MRGDVFAHDGTIETESGRAPAVWLHRIAQRHSPETTCLYGEGISLTLLSFRPWTGSGGLLSLFRRLMCGGGLFLGGRRFETD